MSNYVYNNITTRKAPIIAQQLARRMERALALRYYRTGGPQYRSDLQLCIEDARRQVQGWIDAEAGSL